MPRTSHAPSLPLRLDLHPHGALPVRIAAAIRSLVADGTLEPGTRLPSTRGLADSLGISRGSVLAAYEQLDTEGYVESRRGSGTVVNPGLERLARPGEPLSEPVRPTRQTHACATGGAAAVIDLRPGASRGVRLPNPQWRSAWRSAVNEVAEVPEPLGSAGLRSVLAKRWRHVRGVAFDPGTLIVTAGARDGLALILQALRAAQGVPFGTPLRVAFENPGYPSLRRVPSLMGDQVVAAPTDASGVDPTRLPSAIDALVVTPSHQYPRGGSLTLERRIALLEAAREQGFLLIEDEHTAEWRWEGAPLPTLRGLDDDPGREQVTAMVSSLASLVHPGIGLGFVSVPAQLLTSASDVRRWAGMPVATATQAAMEAFLGSGALDRQLHGAKSRHRRALGLVVERLSAVEGVGLQPVPGGLQAVIRVTQPGFDEDAFVRAARSRGVLVTGLADYWLGEAERGSADGVPDPGAGIVLGFGIDHAVLRVGLRRLVGCLDAVAPSLSSD